MIIKLDEKINIDKLRSFLDFVKASYPPNMKQNGAWGGWSITSSNGEVDDGWQTGEKVNDPNFPEEEKKILRELFANNNFSTPTPLYTGYVIEILDLLTKTDPNLKLSRIRIAVLKPHDESEAYWHIDGEAKGNEHHFRLHIPIITNEKCFFEYEDEKFNLKADGSIYILDISKRHRATNLSDENRYHLIMNVEYKK